MRFIIRIIANVGACIFLMILCLFITNELIAGGILGIFVYAILNFVLLYTVNRLFNKIKFLKLSPDKSLLSITIGVFIVGFEFWFKWIFSTYYYADNILEEIGQYFDEIFAVDCLIMFVLSILLNFILKKDKIKFLKE